MQFSKGLFKSQALLKESIARSLKLTLKASIKSFSVLSISFNSKNQGDFT